MKVKIGPLTYTVVEVDELADDEGDLMGDANYEKLRIRLEKALSPDIKRVVLWHEILHGLLYNAGKREDHDEEYMDIISTGIVQVLQDNKHLRQ